MHLFLVGISHRTATVELRERIDFQTRGLGTALQALQARNIAREAVVLSTCNRSELYGVGDDLSVARGALVQFLSDYHGVTRAELEPHIYSVAGTDVARHAFRVAAGLDSLVVGEPQILGQVKEAHGAAALAHTSGPLLNRLFHSSFGVGKRVRTETGLGSGAVSISFAAVALAKKIFGDLKGRSVLVVGAGEMGKLTALHMKSQGVQQVTIVSRTMASAVRTAEAIGGATAAPWEDLLAQLSAADIVISATGAAAPILKKAQVDSVMRPRRNRPLFIIDIAMPRDVEAAAGEIEQVFLYNVDDLRTTVEENLARRANEVHRAESIVAEEVDKFASWLRSRSAVPIVVSLRQRFDAVRRTELDRLTVGLPPEMRERVDDITRLLVEKLLLTPTEQLKAIGDADLVNSYAEALTRVFNLNTQAAGDAAEEAPRPDTVRAGRRKVEPFVRPQKR
ncbi:MAG: glutamyl-tRNA reductase [Vicinamibacterales bacterium]